MYIISRVRSLVFSDLHSRPAANFVQKWALWNNRPANVFLPLLSCESGIFVNENPDWNQHENVNEKKITSLIDLDSDMDTNIQNIACLGNIMSVCNK